VGPSASTDTGKNQTWGGLISLWWEGGFSPPPRGGAKSPQLSAGYAQRVVVNFSEKFRSRGTIRRVLDACARTIWRIRTKREFVSQVFEISRHHSALVGDPWLNFLYFLFSLMFFESFCCRSPGIPGGSAAGNLQRYDFSLKACPAPYGAIFLLYFYAEWCKTLASFYILYSQLEIIP